MSFVQRIVNVFFKLFLNLKIEGRDNIPKSGGVIIAPNHTSNWDPPLIGSITPRSVRIMAKAELFSNKLSAAFFNAIGAYPVSRGSGDIDAVKKSIRMLRSGEVLIIFPHGKRIKPNEDVPIKEGAVMMALKGEASIVPTYISGTYGFRHKVTVRFGAPMDLSQYYGQRVSVDEQKQLSIKLWDTMKQLGGMAK